MAASASPYDHLYIYLIKGLVPREEEAGFGKSFLGNWVEEDTCFLFFGAPSEAVVSELLKRHSDLHLLENYHFSYEEWQGAFSERIRIDRFLIVPPWLNAVAEAGETKILLDPGLVFGTGLHASTRDSLKALSYVHSRYPIEKVIDLGTGTGVLALASALLGAQRVLAIDLNPLCVKTARKNVQWNQLESRIEVKEGRAEDFAELRADLVLANIHWDVLKTLIAKEGFRKNPWIVLSGLMRSHARDLESDLARYGLRIVKAWEDEATWYTMLVNGEVPKVGKQEKEYRRQKTEAGRCTALGARYAENNKSTDNGQLTTDNKELATCVFGPFDMKAVFCIVPYSQTLERRKKLWRLMKSVLISLGWRVIIALPAEQQTL